MDKQVQEYDNADIRNIPLLDRVDSLRDKIIEGGDEAQEIRRLPDETVKSLVEKGLFRFALPKELGGDDATICETIEVLEAIAAIDGSVAWNVMIGSEINAMVAGGMEPEIAKEVYLENPGVIMCGGGGPGSTPSKAVKQEDGGYKIWGETTFQSGCHQAEWCLMAAPIFENDKPKLDENGMPSVRLWFLNKKDWEIKDTWDVAGMRGSGSHNVVAEGAYVPERLVSVELMKTPSFYPNPVYRVPTALRLAYNKAAVAIGVARGAIDTFVDLAQDKIPMLSVTTTREKPIAQYRIGEAEAKLRAARAFLMESMRSVEDELNDGLEKPSPKATHIGRLACTYAANASMEVADSIHITAGTSGMRMHSPLERKLRDSHACATHRWVAHPLYEDLGKIFLGVEASPEFTGED